MRNYAEAFWLGWKGFLLYKREARNPHPKNSALWCAFETGWEHVAWEARSS